MTKSSILPVEFLSKIVREDIILHLGDLISLEVLNFLDGLCRLEAIKGNCDLSDVRRALPARKVVEIDARKIGLIHGRGGAAETLRSVKAEFQGKVDVALFGHTHLPHYEKDGGTVFFNPGSLCNGRGESNTYGILHLDDKPWGELIEI